MRLCVALILLGLVVVQQAGAEAEGARAIIQKMDSLYRSKTSYAEMEMSIVTPYWQRTLEMQAWTEGMKKTFIRIRAPKKEKGVATLRLGNEMWNYLPNANKVIKIPPSMMMSSWMGSDFTNDDLVKESSLLDDYTFRMLMPDDAEPGILYVELTPLENTPVVWGRIVVAVQKDTFLPVWEKYYDEQNALMRIMRFSEIRNFGGREIPAVMEMLPQNKTGHSTVIRYRVLDFDRGIAPSVFTLRNLRSREE